MMRTTVPADNPSTSTASRTQPIQPTTVRAGTAVPADPRLRLNGEVKLSDILTTLSIMIAAITIVVGIVKDRRLRRREYADRVRAGASKAAVATARRRQISLSLYDAIQPAITQSDVTIVETKDVIKGRDQLWTAVVSARYDLQKRLLEEKIEEAYAALYGYDTRIRQHFEHTMTTLGAIDVEGYESWLDASQNILFEVAGGKKPYKSADFGNPLRESCDEIRNNVAARTEAVVSAFETAMAAIIQASDTDLLKRRLSL